MRGQAFHCKLDLMTPLESYPKLADKMGIKELYFKREDLHPYCSHKGRSIPVMIDRYYEAGDRHFAISSSGNAALAAAIHFDSMQYTDDVSLDIFVGNHISDNKLKKIQDIASSSEKKHPGRIRILKKERPLQALTQATQSGIRSLRQSTDDTALIGYKSLAEELINSSNIYSDARQNNTEQIKIGAIFIGTSSGTTAQALAQHFIDKKTPIQVHIIQTSSCHPISDSIEPYDGPDEISIADAITDKIAQRRLALVPLINQTHGHSWIATNDDIRAAQELTLSTTGQSISTNSALSVAGVMKAVYIGHEIDGAIVCIICGD